MIARHDRSRRRVCEQLDAGFRSTHSIVPRKPIAISFYWKALPPFRQGSRLTLPPLRPPTLLRERLWVRKQRQEMAEPWQQIFLECAPEKIRFPAQRPGDFPELATEKNLRVVDKIQRLTLGPCAESGRRFRFLRWRNRCVQLPA